MSMLNSVSDLSGARVLWGPAEIRARIRETVVDLVDNRYRLAREPLAVVGVLEGARPLFNEVRTLIPPLIGERSVGFDTVGSQLYGNGVRPTANEPVITKVLDHPVVGAHILLVEDIVDTGLTLRRIIADCQAARARSVRVLALCRRTSARALADQRRNLPPGVEIIAIFTYRSERFLVGYGLDLAGRYRSLPFVAAFHPPDDG